jgi:hypothetical protein
MKDRCFVEPVRSTATADTADAASLPLRGIPYDILKEASSRLATISLVYAMLWGLGAILYRVSMASMGVRYRPNPSDAICAASSLVRSSLYPGPRKWG